jgi:hypothetical protein
MDSSGFDALRQSIIDSLDSISASTETVYVGMATAYPALIRELEAGLDKGTDGVRSSLNETLKDTVDGIGTHEAEFSRNHDESSRLFETLADQLRSLGELEASVGRIREDSALMELVSLNALVGAVKAGNAGRAFSSITAELKQLSNQTIELTDEISWRQEALNGVFSEFQSDLQGVDREEAAEFTSFLEHIRVAFSGIEGGSQRLLDGVDAIRRRSEDVKPPLVRVMVGVQNQDSIRQGIDHVLLSLRELDPLGEGDWQARLDQLSFLELLPELSSQVLDEIKRRIQQNRDEFTRHLSEARGQVSRLEDERRGFLDNQKSGSQDLDRGFAGVETLILEFTQSNEGLMRHRESAFRRSTTLQQKVGELVATLRNFDFVTSKFRAIDVASRIEVARQAALASMRGNTSEMTALTQQIERDVGGAILVAEQFFANVETIFGTYRERFEDRRDRDASLKRDLGDAVDRLKDARGLMTRSVGDAHVFTSAFLDQLARTERDLVQLDGLVSTINDQQSGLTVLRDRITQEKRVLLNEQGLESWTLSNNQLKAMVGRFTMFTHKKIAAELGNFEVEDSVESGEVTLF